MHAQHAAWAREQGKPGRLRPGLENELRGLLLNWELEVHAHSVPLT